MDELLEDAMTMSGPTWGGSKKGKAPNIDRSRVEGAQQIEADYFEASPIYNSKLFQRQF